MKPVSQDIDVSAHQLFEWHDRFLAGAERALAKRKLSPQGDEATRLSAILVKATMKNHVLQKKIERLEKDISYYLQKAWK